ncbi:MAG: aspartate aminotransferase family protein [Sphingobacteriia bacterium]|nr:MAG: aspartate aminotransferase family protein [Sphingobacteriia bacterium]
MHLRQVFLDHVAQTSPSPMGLEMVKAKGVQCWDKSGKAYLDAISGFSVCNIGHSHPAVVKAVQDQAADYMHLIVYGEFIEQPQVAYAQLLTQHLPPSLNCVYFTNSGAEATEGAMKLAKRVTGKTQFVAAQNAYHGSTQGALSLMGDEYWRQAFRPLLPGIAHLPYGSSAFIEAIGPHTAAVLLETVQAESGVVKPPPGWLAQVAHRCRAMGALLILDEIQAGFGRTGTLWAFEQMDMVPDILLLGKALGGGMPLGAFVAPRELMQTLTHGPVLGHITTFGGHPVSCAAGKAALEVLLASDWVAKAEAKGRWMANALQHPAFVSVHQHGLWLSVQFASAALAQKVIHRCVQEGLITDWFLFAPDRLRLAPPLSSTAEELKQMVKIVLRCVATET